MSSNNMIYNVKDDPIFQVSSQEPSTSSKSQTYPLSAKSYPILTKLLLIFNQSTTFQSHSSAELSLFNLIITYEDVTSGKLGADFEAT